jgi:hypothetical protein
MAGATEVPLACSFNALRCQTISKAATDTKGVFGKLPNPVATQIAKRRPWGSTLAM